MQKVKILFLCAASGIISIWGLYAYSKKVNNTPNGFIRLLPPHIATPHQILNVGANSWYIAGDDNEHFFLGNVTAPGYIMQVGSALKDTNINMLSISPVGQKIYKSAKLYVDAAGTYLFDGIGRQMFYDTLKRKHLEQRLMNAYFTSAVPVSKGTLILRAVDKKLKQHILLKYTADSIALNKNVLQKQVDGIFCTDGILQYDRVNAAIVYLYYYRNQFVRLDTNLNVLSIGKTIDTVSHVKLSVGSIASQQEVTMSAPPVVVNKASCISNGLLYVYSALKANNEDEQMFSESSDIDVYNVKSGKYLYSFFIHDIDHKKIRDFRVMGKWLLALNGNYISVHELRLPANMQ
ncbi:hypothetical protein [Deminuibacter soli]|uniref:Uncharacterized protein n=1 Tax=Deminuibacter soli TaxID=2291815 RepID=A0A3E1NL69_9BACT|nr:hypothetical protein [Deminuibacter soli]RFM28676.1 hypothetical protein DXN05_07745 [Deminuibacter soli]